MIFYLFRFRIEIFQPINQLCLAWWQNKAQIQVEECNVIETDLDASLDHLGEGEDVSPASGCSQDDLVAQLEELALVAAHDAVAAVGQASVGRHDDEVVA